MRRTLTLFIFAAFFAALLPSAQAEVNMRSLEKRLNRSTETFLNVNASNAGPIPAELLARAQGILIVRQYGAGFWVGGKGGFGVVMARQGDGRWGTPAFMKAIDGNFGLQIGGQRIEVVMLFMNKDSMRAFREGKFRLGVGAGAAAGPAGANAEGKIGAPILVYADNTGLYLGATVEGGVLVPDNEANEAFYNTPGVTVPDIIFRGGMAFPSEAEGLRAALERHEGRRARAGSQPRY